VAGLVGGLAAGAAMGFALDGYELWQTNLAAVAGATILAVGAQRLTKSRAGSAQA
jgi:hypothetical protein